MIITRRNLLGGLGALFVAPAIVRAESIMPVRVMMPDFSEWAFVTRVYRSDVVDAALVQDAVDYVRVMAAARLGPGERFEVLAQKMDFSRAVDVICHGNTHMIMKRHWGDSKPLDLAASFVVGEFVTPESTS